GSVPGRPGAAGWRKTKTQLLAAGAGGLPPVPARLVLVPDALLEGGQVPVNRGGAPPVGGRQPERPGPRVARLVRLAAGELGLRERAHELDGGDRRRRRVPLCDRSIERLDRLLRPPAVEERKRVDLGGFGVLAERDRLLGRPQRDRRLAL